MRVYQDFKSNFRCVKLHTYNCFTVLLIDLDTDIG